MTRAVPRSHALREAARRRPLVDWIPAATPGFLRPTHALALCELLERATVEPVRAVVMLPPRHAKTEIVTHAIPFALCRNPAVGFIVACHTQALADRTSRRARALASDAGLALDKAARARAEWRTREGGGVKAVGVGGALVGHGARVALMDDLTRNRVEAENPRLRDAKSEWIASSLLTRLEPGGSAVYIGHPWTDDDPAFRLIRSGWEEVRLPAILEEGEPDERALWPERYGLEELHRIRAEVGPREWAALYAGRPRPAGEALFSGLATYEAHELPQGLTIGIGIDLGYSTRSSSDYTAIVVVGRDPSGVFYVLEVIRGRQPIESTGRLLADVSRRYGGTSPRWYCGGQERAIVDTLRALAGVHIDARAALADKATRAQATSAAWARGAIRLPRAAPWLSTFCDELYRFPHGRHDDVVDALVAAYDARAGGAWMHEGPVWRPAGRPSMASRMGGSSPRDELFPHLRPRVSWRGVL